MAFVSHFFQMGIPAHCNLSSLRLRPLNSIKRQLSKPLVAESFEKLTESSVEVPSPDYVVFKKPPHPIEFRYSPQVLCHYPQNSTLPSHVSMFCFPDQLKLQLLESNEIPCVDHSFIITLEDGSKLHGVVIIVYEKPSPDVLSQLQKSCDEWRASNVSQGDLDYVQHLKTQIENAQKQLEFLKLELERALPVDRESMEDSIHYAEEKIQLFQDLLRPMKTNVLVDTSQIMVPKAIGLLSPWPFYDILSDWLKAMVWTMRNTNMNTTMIESFIVNLFHEVPVPPLGKHEISLTLNEHILFCHRRPPNELIGKHFSFYPLFRVLSIENIVMMFECLLHEQKVAFVSSHLNMLTLAAESICLLLFPLKWQGILIPVLPAGLIPYLEAPVPFIVGVHSSYMPPDDDLSDVVIVNLDSNNVRVPKPVPQVPHSKRQRLLHRLKSAVRLRQHGINYGAPLSVVESFPFSRFTPSCNKSAVMVRTSRKKSSRLSRKSSQMSESGSRTPSFLTTKSSATTLSPSQDSLNVGRTKSNPALNLPAGPGHQSNAAKATGMDKKMVHKRSFVDMFKSKISSSNLMSQKSSNNIKSALSPASSTNSLGDTLTSSAHSINQYSIEGHTLVPFTSLIMNHQTGLGQNKYSLFGSHKTEISVSVVLQEGEICTSCSGACENIEDVWRCEACNATCHSGCRHAILTPCPKAFNESEVRKAFLKLFVSLFKTFPQYLNLPSANPVLNESPKEAIFNPDEFFKKEAFLEDLDDEVEVFLRGLIETQAFSQFLANRIEGTESSDLQYEILFFDELLKEKASRKAFNIKSHNSTFLKDQSFKISSTYHCPPPHRPSPPRIHNYTEQPIPLLDPSILSSIPKRPITSITSPQEEVILKNYIKNYHRQARIQQSLKKNTASQQEFSNWVKRAAVGLNWGGGGSGGLGTSSDDSSSPDGSMIARPLNMLEKRALIARKMDKTYSLLNDPILKATRYNSTVEQLQYVIQSLQSHETQLAELVSGINPDKRDLEEIETVLEQIKQLIQIYELELEALMPSPTDHSQVPHSPTSPVSSFPPNVVTSSQGAHLAGGAQNSPVRSIRPLSKDFSTASKIVMLEIDIPNTEFAIAFNDDGWRSRSAKGSTAGENAESAKKSGTSETGKEGEQKIQVVPEEPTNSEATTSSHSNFKVVPAQPDAEVMKEKVEEEDLEKPVEIVAADSSEAFVPKVESIPQDSPLPPEKPAVSENSHDKTPETEPKSEPVPTATDPLPEKSQESNSVPDSSNTTTEPQEQQAQQESSKLDSIATASKVMTDENGKTGEVLVSVKVEGGL